MTSFGVSVRISAALIGAIVCVDHHSATSCCSFLLSAIASSNAVGAPKSEALSFPSWKRSAIVARPSQWPLSMALFVCCIQRSAGGVRMQVVPSRSAQTWSPNMRSSSAAVRFSMPSSLP